ncbi:MAG: UDP-3-O-[3-hydroxymyristoyl] N-acetylglucosamine deacetylase [Saprospiraceae bacterium]|jgi:UDP-3-O-[3-hydroxymyristoyl] N-acetylglucosamine deacetylase/3-hydroxyacyl-[acyl-carrier-protein] dehydratase
MAKQQTIKKAFSVKGIGLHTGESATMTFRPAAAGHGFKFQRIDLDKQPIIPADVSKVSDTKRGTTIQIGEAQVTTVEHALSALVGCGVDNCLIEIDGGEAPILDGSNKTIVNNLAKVGLEEQDADRAYFVIEEPISYKNEETGAEFLALPADNFELTVFIDYDSPVLGQQYAELTDWSDYAKEIAPCRTFVFLRELEQLAKAGLIKGGDLDNAVVIADEPMSKKALTALAKLLDKPSMEVDKEGVLNTTSLRFKNEPARHKLLDVIGDLTLIGQRIKGKIIAKKPGHASNVEFAKILKTRLVEQRKLGGKPKYDENVDPIYTANQIYELLPHRYPFQLVDKIIELTDTKVVGVKNVSMNEPFFKGHFPGNPVMPGVLQTEAMAQTGGILALTKQDDPYGWDTYFLKLNNVKFKKMVVPGDTLIIKCELLAPIRRGIVQMHATVYVGNSIVSEAELTAQIVKRE